jgi:hypothetical protein
MSSLWLKIKIWTKLVAFALVLIYVFFFLYNNWGETFKVWLWFGKAFDGVHSLTLAFWCFVAGVVVTLLSRTIASTIKQIREASANAKRVQMEKDLADMKAKSARLQAIPESKPEQNV